VERFDALATAYYKRKADVEAGRVEAERMLVCGLAAGDAAQREQRRRGAADAAAGLAKMRMLLGEAFLTRLQAGCVTLCKVCEEQHFEAVFHRMSGGLIIRAADRFHERKAVGRLLARFRRMQRSFVQCLCATRLFWCGKGLVDVRGYLAQLHEWRPTS
jgi:hypothetical protein